MCVSERVMRKSGEGNRKVFHVFKHPLLGVPAKNRASEIELN